MTPDEFTEDDFEILVMGLVDWSLEDGVDPVRRQMLADAAMLLVELADLAADGPTLQ